MRVREDYGWGQVHGVTHGRYGPYVNSTYVVFVVTEGVRDEVAHAQQLAERYTAICGGYSGAQGGALHDGQ